MTKVLFVDDEPDLLSGIRRSLRRAKVGWDVGFAEGGFRALEQFESEGPYDVVVSDMRMPGMDGAELLSQVKSRYPRTARVILSGYSEEDAIARSLSVAHQFLSKPCDPAQVISIVEQMLEVQRRLGNTTLIDNLGDVDVLPSPTESVKLLNEAVSHGNSVDEVASIVERDTAMTVRVLRAANCAFFGVSQPVSEVLEAVTLLGVTTVRNVLTASEMVGSFTRSSDRLQETADAIDSHSGEVARLAHFLVDQEPRASVDAYAAGMLHDIGLLALASHAPESLIDLYRSKPEGRSLVEFEQESFGTTHAELGAYIIGLWGLPYAIVESVARHHDTPIVPADDHVNLTLAVQLAERMTTDRIAMFEAAGAIDPELAQAVSLEERLSRRS